MSRSEPDPATPRPDPDPADPTDRTDPVGPSALGDHDVAILDFEREWWRFAGAKEVAVRERFGLSATDYHQRLARLIDDDAALAHDPLLVRRLRRRRLVRRRERSTRRTGRL